MENRYQKYKEYYKNYERDYQRKWRKSSKYKDGRTALLEKRRQFIRGLKTEKPCADCGITYLYYVLDFHHVKKRNFSITVTHSINAIKKEVENCVLICANCHRIRTHGKEK